VIFQKVVTASGSPTSYKETSTERGLIPADYGGWANLPLKGTFLLLTHFGVPWKGWLWASPGQSREAETAGTETGS
jgi:hypothetical protein